MKLIRCDQCDLELSTRGIANIYVVSNELASFTSTLGQKAWPREFCSLACLATWAAAP